MDIIYFLYILIEYIIDKIALINVYENI